MPARLNLPGPGPLVLPLVGEAEPAAPTIVIADATTARAHGFGTAAATTFAPSAGLTVYNTAEGGTDGTTVTQGSGGNTGGASGDYFDIIVIGAGNTLKFRNTPTLKGALAYEMASVAATQNYLESTVNRIFGSTQAALWSRWYCYIGVAASANANVYRWRGALPTLNVLAQLRVNGGTHKFELRDSGLTVRWTSTASEPVGAMYRVETYWTVSTMRVRLFLGANVDGTTADEDSGDLAFTFGAEDSDYIGVGAAGTTTAFGTRVFDDIALSNQAWIGPSGGVVVTANAAAAEAHARAQAAALAIQQAAAQGRVRARASSVANVVVTSQAQAQARGRAAALSSVVVSSQAQGRARGRGTLAFSIAGAVQTFAQAHGRARATATALGDRVALIVTGQGHGRSRARAASIGNVVTASTAQGRVRGRATGVAIVTTTTQAHGRSRAYASSVGNKLVPTITGNGVGWARGRGTSIGTRIVPTVAVGYSRARAQAASIAVVAGQATSRARGFAATVGNKLVPTVTGIGVGRARARGTGVGVTTTLTQGIGRARGRGTSVAAPITTSAQGVGRARGRGTAAWTVAGIVTAQAVARVRGRAQTLASAITTARGHARAKAYARTIGVRIAAALGIGRAKGRAIALTQPITTSARGVARAHTYAAANGTRVLIEPPWQEEFDRTYGGVVGVSPIGALDDGETPVLVGSSPATGLRAQTTGVVRMASPKASTMQPHTEGAR